MKQWGNRLNFFNVLGHHNDARMNVALGMTAAYHGATVANHCEVVNLTKDDKGIVNGAVVRDVMTGEEWTVKAKVQEPFDQRMGGWRANCELLIRVLSTPPVLSLMACARWITRRTPRSLLLPPVSTLSYPTTTALATWVCLIPLRAMVVSFSSCPGKEALLQAQQVKPILQGST